MGSTGNSERPFAWMLRRPLQIERLRKDLPQSADIEASLRELQLRRENVDAVIFALSNRRLATNRRALLLEILRRHQDALDQCLTNLGVTEYKRRDVPLWYFHQLDPMARRHLTAILGVAEKSEYYEVLDIKAAEYLSQQAAFEALARRMGFRESRSMPRRGKQPALLLTLSGSLIQLSATLSDRAERRYLYQNIYGNIHPPEGVLVLDRDVRQGHRMRSVELTSSPVWSLRTLRRRMPWQSQTRGFSYMAQTLNSLISRSESLLAAAGVRPAGTGLQRQANPEAVQRVLRESYEESFTRFDELRRTFIQGDDSDGQAARQVEAELLMLCHRLQRAAQEFGFEAHYLDQTAEFISEGERLYQVDPRDVSKITLTPKGDGPDIVFSGVSVGRQSIIRHAPLALISADGGLVEVTRPVLSFRAKG